MSSLVKTRAIVVKSMQYGESDLIVTFLTEGSGMLKGIAKGGMRSRKRFAGCFEPFTFLDITCKVGETGGLARIDTADILDAHYGIRDSLDKIEAGARVLELVSAVEVSGPETGPVFMLLRETLGLLEKASNAEALSGVFFVKYLGMSGYKIPHESCARCGKPLLGAGAFYSGGHSLYCADCNPVRDSLTLSPGSLAFIKRAEEISIGMMARLRVTKPAAHEVFGFLGRYVEGVIGKSLKTLEIIR
jgi:DNA repair protein RecO (recombination protein O)